MMGSTPIVAGSIPVGVGLAFASKLARDSNITIIFFGEGATEEGVVAESLNFAALQQLPVLFVCENNYYSVYSPLDVRQPKERDRLGIARAHGLYVDSGYGNDVEAVYSITKTTVDRIRQGGGPAFLEFNTYRHREHCGPYFDNHIGYRTEAEFEQWLKECPIERYVSKYGIDVTDLRVVLQQEIDAAFRFADESPFPEVTNE
jgi:pyruvate dehydrogenase E1 component alpha subunit